VLQPITWIWGVGRGQPTLVAFSLGNAIFDQGAPPSARLGALFWVEIKRSGLGKACAFPFQANLDHWIVSADHENAKKISRMVGLTCTKPIISSVEDQ
jgi:poly-gamma-glutamate capsule biosynthesis protein CapA/YwtB (metallophosphatase superfamily)